MIKLYTALNAAGFELCQPVDNEDFETINLHINGTPRRASWKPIAMQLVHRDRGRKLVRSDAPWLGSGALIFRSSVIQAMGSMLKEYGELLPLTCSDPDVVIYNPTRVIDALDEGASTLERFTSSGRIMRIKRYVFRTDVLNDVEIFKIPNLRVSPVFLSERFVALWQASDLKGLEFEPVLQGLG